MQNGDMLTLLVFQWPDPSGKKPCKKFPFLTLYPV